MYFKTLWRTEFAMCLARRGALAALQRADELLGRLSCKLPADDDALLGPLCDGAAEDLLFARSAGVEAGGGGG